MGYKMSLVDSLPIIDLQLDCEVNLRGELAKRLVEYAERFNTEPVELLADIIEAVLDQDLVEVIKERKKTVVKLGLETPSLYELKQKGLA
jgi:hypothetical protein